MSDENKRSRFEILRAQLDAERSTFIPHYRDLSDYILPRRQRFQITDVNKGDRRNHKIIDSTATLAARTLRAGMMGGITSPARPWKRLTTPDPDLAEFSTVKEWLSIVDQRMSTTFLKSNLYNSLPIIYGDIGVFATSAMMIEEDFKEVVRTYPFAIGSYYIANDAKLKVNVFMREFRMTVRQVVNKFGQKKISGSPDWSNFSEYVKNAWEQGRYEQWVDIVHVIQPNEDFDSSKIYAKDKKFLSCYYERGSMGNTMDRSYDKLLLEDGYDYFPVLCPRWEVTGEDVYGTDCPGMSALGDIKQLQMGEKRSAQAIEKMVNPPMTGPTSLKNQKTSILPADITYLDVREGQQGFRPVHEVNPRIMELEQKQAQVRLRIQKSFYEDLFLMLANSDRREITAREIDERHEEKLLALGPVLEQLNQDLLDPLIDITFDIMLKQGHIPPPPEELQGIELKVEYISVMAQAQKLVGISGIERFASFVSQVGTVSPEALDKVDTDEMIDSYGNMTSVPPKIVRSEEKVAGIRNQRAKAQQAMQMTEMLEKGAGAAKDLSQSDTSGDNLLTQLGQAGQLAPQ